ncbi:MAG: DUF6261 family protein [Bacteroidales bacterium]|jgi:hypothetical protein|nr:DUF6261 family protein [Bacteroidales bacterium]
MKIERINLRRLRNEEWFQFMTEFNFYVKDDDRVMTDIGELYDKFAEAYNLSDEVLQQLRKSIFTPVIQAADAKRDELFRGLRNTMEAAIRHYLPQMKEAATIVMPVFETYGDLAKKPYNEETAGIYNLIQDLRSKYQSEVATLGISPWIDALDNANKDFEESKEGRTSEYSQAIEVNMLEARKQTDSYYMDIVVKVEALSIVNGDAPYERFIRLLNANIDQYKESISRHTTQPTEE